MIQAKTFLLSLFFTLGTIALDAQDRIIGLPHATRSEVIAKNGLACTSQPVCSQDIKT